MNLWFIRLPFIDIHIHIYIYIYIYIYISGANAEKNGGEYPILGA